MGDTAKGDEECGRVDVSVQHPASPDAEPCQRFDGIVCESIRHIRHSYRKRLYVICRQCKDLRLALNEKIHGRLKDPLCKRCYAIRSPESRLRYIPEQFETACEATVFIAAGKVQQYFVG